MDDCEWKIARDNQGSGRHAKAEHLQKEAEKRYGGTATTQAFYIKSVAEDSKLAMAKLQTSLRDRNWTGLGAITAKTEMVN